MVCDNKHQQLKEVQAARRQTVWEQIMAVHAMIRERRGDEPITPSPGEIMRQMREERSEASQRRRDSSLRSEWQNSTKS